MNVSFTKNKSNILRVRLSRGIFKMRAKSFEMRYGYIKFIGLG